MQQAKFNLNSVKVKILTQDQEINCLGLGISNLNGYRPIFVVGTDTDVGKTYVTARLCKGLQDVVGLSSSDICYFKPVISGASINESNDASIVRDFAALSQDLEDMCLKFYADAVSPHLAAQMVGDLLDHDQVLFKLSELCNKYKLMVLEGSGGIFCPIRWDSHQISPDCRRSFYYGSMDSSHYTVLDLVYLLSQLTGVSVVVVADAKLGAINQVMCTVSALCARGIEPSDITVVFNRFTGEKLQQDNIKMISNMTGGAIEVTAQLPTAQLASDDAASSAALCNNKFLYQVLRRIVL